MMQQPNSLTHPPPEPGCELEKGGTWGGMHLNYPKWKLLRVPPLFMLGRTWAYHLNPLSLCWNLIVVNRDQPYTRRILITFIAYTRQ